MNKRKPELPPLQKRLRSLSVDEANEELVAAFNALQSDQVQSIDEGRACAGAGIVDARQDRKVD